MQPTHTPLDIIKRFESQTSPALDVSVSDVFEALAYGSDRELEDCALQLFFDRCTTAHHDDTTDPYYDD
jgi:hypothetical protein